MIRQWLIAAKLLMRYKLRYSPFICIGQGEYTQYTCRFTGKSLKSVVRVNPFDPDFIETFLHEIGHHVYRIGKGQDRTYRNLINNSISYEMYRNNEDWYPAVLEEEVFASKFAYKTSRKLKVQCSKAKLLQWFYTYTGAGYKYLSKAGVDRTAYTDHVSKLINKLERA